MIFYIYNTFCGNFNRLYNYTVKLINSLRLTRYEVSNKLINIKLSVLKLDKRVIVYRCRNNL